MARSVDLLLKIAADTRGAVREIDKVTGNLKGVDSQGKKSQGAISGAFDKMRGAASRVPPGVYAIGGAVAGAGLAIAKFGLDSVEKFASATAEVREFQRATGDTAQDASKMVFVLKRLGVDTGQAGKGFFRLGREIATGKQHLDKFGVSAVHHKDGTLNLSATVANLADKFSKMSAADRAAAAFDLFGKAGQNLLPILGKTKKEIQEIEKLAALNHAVFSDSDLEKGKQFTLAMKDLKSAVQGIALEFGRALIPAVTETTTSVTDLVHTLDDTASSVGGIGGLFKAAFDSSPIATVTGSLKGLSDVFSGNFSKGGQELLHATPLIGSFEDLVGIAPEVETHLGKFEAAQAKVAETTKKASESGFQNVAANHAMTQAKDELTVVEGHYAKIIGETTSAQKAQEQSTNALRNAVLGLSDAQRGPIAAHLATADAVEAEIQSQEALNVAKIKGKQADETQEQFLRRIAGLERDHQRSLLDIASARDREGQAAVAAGIATDAYNKFAADPKARNEVLAQLHAAQVSYPAQAGLIQQIIDKINATPTRHVTYFEGNADGVYAAMNGIRSVLGNFHPIITPVIGGSGTNLFGKPFATGGPIPGPAGRAVPIVAHGGEYVLSADVVSRIKRGAPSSGARVAGGSAAPSGGGGLTIKSVVVQVLPGHPADMGAQIMDGLAAYVRSNGSAALKKLAGGN